MSNDCIFCDVSDDALVIKTDEGIVLLDDPVCPGHVLVGARSHGSGLSDISADDAAAMMKLANKVSKSIVKQTGAEKVYVAAIGDKDKHFHVHLLPKQGSDPNLGPYIFGSDGWISFMKDNLDAAAVDAISEGIRKSVAE